MDCDSILITTNKEEFILEELKIYNLNGPMLAKDDLEEMAIPCDICGIFYFEGCMKRCNCGI